LHPQAEATKAVEEISVLAEGNLRCQGAMIA